MRVGTALLSCLMLAASAFAAAPVRVVYDTDIGNDVDDAIGLAMLHAFETRGESRLLAVTSAKTTAMPRRSCRCSTPSTDGPIFPSAWFTTAKPGRRQVPPAGRRDEEAGRISALPAPRGRPRHPARGGRAAPPRAGKGGGRGRDRSAGRLQHQPGASAGIRPRRRQPPARPRPCGAQGGETGSHAGHFPSSPRPEYNVQQDVPSAKRSLRTGRGRSSPVASKSGSPSRTTRTGLPRTSATPGATRWPTPTGPTKRCPMPRSYGTRRPCSTPCAPTRHISAFGSRNHPNRRQGRDFHSWNRRAETPLPGGKTMRKGPRCAKPSPR